MPSPQSRLFHVSVSVSGLGAESIDFAFPAWTPGSYKVRDYARNVQDVDGSHPVRKIDKQTWRVDAGGKDVRLSFKVYANELNVRGLHLDEDHGYFNGAALLPYVDGHKESPVTLAVNPPKGWRVATGLGLDGTSFHAPSYDVLIDSPVECGRFQLYSWRTRGKVHRLVIHGQGNYDAKTLVRDLGKIVETEARMFGGLPYDHYTFLLHLTASEGGGGLEHLNSTSLQVHPMTFKPRKRYERFLELAAHEFFHLWNVKRIHPAGLGPFDYSKEVHTTLLWAMEGVTSYYDWLIPRRAGLVSEKRYLDEVAERLQIYDEKPGRRHQSLSESSYDAWTRFYNPNEHTANSQVSYYEKGAIVAMLLDLEIRRMTKNAKSLDDMMRLLWEEYGKRGVGFPEPEYRRAAERVAGRDLGAFWREFVDGRADLPYNRFLAAAGLRIVAKGNKDGLRERAWLGIGAGRAGDRVLVTSVREGSPAERAGLTAKDEILAFDGVRVDAESWATRLEERKPGEELRIDFFRDARRRVARARLDGKPNVKWTIEPLKRRTKLQDQIRKSWLG